MVEEIGKGMRKDSLQVHTERIAMRVLYDNYTEWGGLTGRTKEKMDDGEFKIIQLECTKEENTNIFKICTSQAKK